MGRSRLTVLKRILLRVHRRRAIMAENRSPAFRTRPLRAASTTGPKRDEQKASLSPACDGPTHRSAEAAWRANHEGVERRSRRAIQHAAAQSGARAEDVRSFALPALGNVGAVETQRIRHPDRRAAVALAGGLVRARAAGDQGRAV